MTDRENMTNDSYKTELYEIWYDISNDLDEIKKGEGKRSEWGYNNLYSRSFVNKLRLQSDKITENIAIKLFIALLSIKQKEIGYLTITIIKCFIELKDKFVDKSFLDNLRDMLTKKIDNYQNHLEKEQDKIRFRGLRTLLTNCRSQI